MELNKLIGKQIMLYTRLNLNEGHDGFYEATLCGVESGGIWISSEPLKKVLASMVSEPELKRVADKFLYFLPYSEIRFAIALEQ